MKTLYIDTHYNDINIVLFEDGIIKSKNSIIGKKNNSEFIFPTIIKTISDEKLDEIIVVNGPGSFTGIRLGVTIAKCFAYSLNIPIYTVTSLECLAISCNNKKVKFSDGNGFYYGNFENNYDNDNIKYIKNKDIDTINIDSYVDSSIIEFDYEKIYKYVKENKVTINPHRVNPIYIKKIDVEK